MLQKLGLLFLLLLLVLHYHYLLLLLPTAPKHKVLVPSQNMPLTG